MVVLLSSILDCLLCQTPVCASDVSIVITLVPNCFYLFVFCQLMLCPGDTCNRSVNSPNTKKPVHIYLKLSQISSKHFKAIIPLVYKWKLLDPTDNKRPPRQKGCSLHVEHFHHDFLVINCSLANGVIRPNEYLNLSGHSHETVFIE